MKAQGISLILILLIVSSISGCIAKNDDELDDDIEKNGWNIYVTYPGEDVSTEMHVTSSPHKKDTDGDGLTDYEEWSSSMGGRTNPREKDTDRDGLTDYEEAQLGTDPTSWRHDLGNDNGWWKGDYEEIKYYQSRGIDHETILEFLKNPDVDGDGVKDGYDIDPLANLTIKLTIESIKITSDMNDKDYLLEIIFDFVTDGESNSSTLIYVPVGVKYSVNMSMKADLSDTGIPGKYNNSISLTVIDEDMSVDEYRLLDPDKLPDMDIVRITPYGSYANSDFDISSDCKSYHLSGSDGEIWFSIEDASIPWS
ncbi:MAG: hypothetical protein U9O96_07875 [Candidatus Thermoplasmatota archaeon]|nr:hypothetical protein [Candidatus Thermoplasmatota archaeon]